LKSTKKPPKTAKKTRKFRKPKIVQYVKFDTQRYRISKQIVFSVILIFAMGVGVAATLAYLQYMRFEIARTRTAIQSQQDENLRTQAEIIRHLSIEEISEIAQTRLNMHPPDVSQIINISVPRESYVVQSAAPANIETQNIFQAMLQQVRTWLGV